MPRRLVMRRRIACTWLKRFVNQRLAGLSDKTGWGRKSHFSPRDGGAVGAPGRFKAKPLAKESRAKAAGPMRAP